MIAIRAGAGAAQVDAGVAAEPTPEPIAIDVRLTSGNPGDRLIEATDGLDLLVCGSHGRGRALAAIFGSVSGRLATDARCPVVIVPPKSRHRGGTPLGLTTAAD